MKHLRDSRILPGLMLMVGLSLISSNASAADDTPVASSEPTTAGDQQRETRKPKLRFKRGPVCLCNNGLSESDIQKGKLKRLDSSSSDK